MAAKKKSAKKQPTSPVAELEKQIAALIIKREKARDKQISSSEKGLAKAKQAVAKLQAKEKTIKTDIGICRLITYIFG